MSTVDRNSVIADEQLAVNHIYDCVDQDQKAVESFRSSSLSDCPDAGLSPHPDLPREYGRREGHGGHHPLVIARIDLLDDPDDRLTWYIGRATVRDRQSDLALVKWTSKAATAWRLATPDQPADVRRQRQLRCSGSQVLDYSDTEIQVINASGETVPAPAAEDEPDLFLLADLDLARDGAMRDIVETIQRHQLRLVADERKGVLVIQGGPGTGKTAVGLHRVTWLLDNQHFTPEQVLVIGPHKAFLHYVRDVLPRLGSRGVATVDIAELWPGDIRGTDPVTARLIKSDERMARVLHNAVENRVRGDLATDETFNFRGARVEIDKTELVRLVEAARGAKGSYLIRRRRFIDTTIDWLMTQYTEATRVKKTDDGIRTQLEKTSAVSALFNRVWPSVSAEQVLRHLLADRDSLAAAAFGVLTLDEQATLVRPQARRVGDEPWSPEDLVCLEELRWLLTGDNERRYQHLVIDEAQDLTPMQARSLARWCPSGSMTILGDLAQSTGIRQYDVWERLADVLAAAEGWHIAELGVGYRVPAEVMKFAAMLGTKVSPSTAIPVSARPSSPDALEVVAISRQRVIAETVSRAQRLAMKDNDQARSVAVLTPSKYEFLSELTHRITAAQESTLPGIGQQITVMPAHMAKGLEFDHVVVMEPHLFDESDRMGLRRLYVALTRCTQSLTVLHSSPLPAELGGPNKKPVVNAETAEAAPSPALERFGDGDGFRAALKERTGVDRKQAAHARLKHMLVAELYGNDRVPQLDTDFADIVCEGEDGVGLYLISTQLVDTYTELRTMAPRLLEAAWADGREVDRLFLVLSRQPQDLWAVDVIKRLYDVATIWKTETGWAGLSVDTALGQ
ncbi:HelD family protein [Nonomuraea longicatena]|uniref:UvrD-like helicase ATP-binding domain-containing protein n=1 Tax=Nonomuraea longicatena TaxID=83682 RepID=A0ABN1NVS7_9ACTN